MSPKRSEPQGACYKPLSWGSSSGLGLEGGGSGHSSVSKGATIEGLFPAEGLLVALGGFSLGFLVALGGFSLGFLVALGGFSLGFLVALGGFSFPFLGGLVDPSTGCFVTLGPLSFFPFFPLSLFFSGGTAKDEDVGLINQSPFCVPMWSLRMPTAWVWRHLPAPGIDQETGVSHLLKWQNEIRVQASYLHISSPQHQLSAALKARHEA